MWRINFIQRKTAKILDHKLLSYLGLAMRAGKLITGEETVLKAVRSAQAALVVIAGDASDNTKKKFSDKCGYYNVPFAIVETREDLGKSIGKMDRVVIAVTDQGFAKMIGKCLNLSPEVDHIE